MFRPCLIILLFFSSSLSAEWRAYQTEAMTTRFELYYWFEQSPSKIDRINSQAKRLLVAIEEEMSTYIGDSAISRINEQAYPGPVPMSERMLDVIHHSLWISKISDGAFDITYESFGRLYDLRSNKAPSALQLKPYLDQFSYQDIVLSTDRRLIAFSKPGVFINVGGIAKGYAIDQIVGMLREEGVQHARVSLGGDMYVLGDKRGQPWIVGVRDPRGNESDNATILPLTDVAVSTSGDYERFFINEKGERVHHILSTKTGKPSQASQAVTVLGPSAMTTDGLSTALFILGAEAGIEMINQLDGYDAIVIDPERVLRYSAGLGAPAE